MPASLAPPVISTRYLAIDLGAESGRVMLGTLTDGCLMLEEIHRFTNRNSQRDGHLRWDLAHLEGQIFAGLELAARRREAISSVSTDSWAVDYVLVNPQNAALSEPICYRDNRTEEGTRCFFEKLPFAEIYALTGIQFLPFNTLYQLEAETIQNATGLNQVDHFLLIADYFNARMSGVAAIDESMASTTQIYDPRAGDWSAKLISLLGIKPSLFPKIVPSGTVLGRITGSLAHRESFRQTQVVASCSHDTGAAVAAVPAKGQAKWAYLSSGTWSLLGAELSSPIMTEAARTAGFTNEVGLGGTIRFLKNIAGLWVVQECRRAWEATGQMFTYDDLVRQATESGPASAHISLKDLRFVSAGDMPEKIAAYCRETGQPIPLTTGQIIRVVLESLALTYAQTLRELESIVGHRMEVLHLVGGGGRNELLNQLTADAIGIPVITGPIEATAIGNVLIQALALGHLTSATQIRETIAASFPTQIYQPSSDFSDEVRTRFQKL